jgi:hypothetical protein
MAQSEILGLFGKNVQQLRNEYRDSNMISPAQMGSQGLLQQVVSMGGNAGATLGGMLGGQVPGERESMAVDQAMQDSSDPSMTQAQRMRRVAELLSQQPGMSAQAMQALEAANALDLKELQSQKAQQDLTPEFKDIKLPTTKTVMGADGVLREEQGSKTLTYRYNPATKQYEPFTGGASAAAGGEEVPAPSATKNTGQSKTSAEAAQKRKDAKNYNPSLTPRPTPPPAAASRGMTYGFEGQGMVNPEGF